MNPSDGIDKAIPAQEGESVEAEFLEISDAMLSMVGGGDEGCGLITIPKVSS